MQVTSYNLKKIPVKIQRRFPEHIDLHHEMTADMAQILYVIESNLLFQIDRLEEGKSSYEIKSSEVDTALRICIFKILEKVTGEEYDTSIHEEGIIKDLVYAVLYAFDPFTNEDVKKILSEQTEVEFDLSNLEMKKDYFLNYVNAICMLLKSLEIRDQMHGYNGYVHFLKTEQRREFKGGTDKLGYITMIL
ncbi:hypothetical protein [Succinivibrio dextrinosolvens]|jgi:hypothetical protein|uniref:hypothetical protein n=1 Tax=Succinivibrio dextrinosolvens TaxID=83771 RepID=UPI00241FE7DA|nr:hypothetical protein [Succinivibrio dextrinosolvens]MBE6422206.1 hypothetical protein [Succinivibrio dextrinosolvens]MBQ3679564.1 hypothetical protein [Succinivibrio sp.]